MASQWQVRRTYRYVNHSPLIGILLERKKLGVAYMIVELEVCKCSMWEPGGDRKEVGANRPVMGFFFSPHGRSCFILLYKHLTLSPISGLTTHPLL